MSAIRCFINQRNFPLKRFYSQKSTSNQKPTKTAEDAQKNINVPGLSSYVIKQKAEPLGPGASKTKAYKVPEYFCYDRFSYHGAEVELAQFRCPQPSALK